MIEPIESARGEPVEPPIRTKLFLKTPGGQQLLLGYAAGADAHHCLAQVLGDFGDNLGVIVMSDGLDDSVSAPGRVAGLENARANEYAIGPQLHHQSSVGWGS